MVRGNRSIWGPISNTVITANPSHQAGGACVSIAVCYLTSNHPNLTTVPVKTKKNIFDSLLCFWLTLIKHTLRDAEKKSNKIQNDHV